MIEHPQFMPAELKSRRDLLWGREHGARQAWLQVVAEKGPATKLYESEGFSEVYSYAYRQAPDGFHG